LPIIDFIFAENNKLRTKNYFPPHPNPLPPSGEGNKYKNEKQYSYPL